VSFTTPTDGIIIGCDNNIGAQIWATDDGGRTTAAAQLGGASPLMLLHGAAVRDSSVVSGLLAAWSCQDGGATVRARHRLA
jgi:hypothetical protein